jgi:hypothetical protein
MADARTCEKGAALAPFTLWSCCRVIDWKNMKLLKVLCFWTLPIVLFLFKTPALVHKPHIPLTPIGSNIDSSCYALSDFIHKILSPLPGNTDFSVKNSEHVIKLIQGINLPGEDYLVSSDDVSPFTHVPVKEVLQVIRNRRSTNPSFPERSPLQVEDIMELLNICVTTTYFQFENKLPHRVKMGVVHCLIKRAKVTCQDQNDFSNEIKNVRHDLMINTRKNSLTDRL